MNMRLNLLAILCGLAGNIQAMNEVELQNLKQIIQNAKDKDAVFDALPDTDFYYVTPSSSKIYFSLDIGFYTLEAPDKMTVTPSLAILNQCFATDVRNAIRGSTIQDFIDGTADNIGLEKYELLFNADTQYNVARILNRIGDDEYIPNRFKDFVVQNSRTQVIEFKNFRKIDRLIQLRANQLRYLVDPSMVNWCRLYPRKALAIGTIAAITLAACYAAYKYWWASENKEDEQEDQQNPVNDPEEISQEA